LNNKNKVKWHCRRITDVKLEVGFVGFKLRQIYDHNVDFYCDKIHDYTELFYQVYWRENEDGKDQYNIVKYEKIKCSAYNCKKCLVCSPDMFKKRFNVCYYDFLDRYLEKKT
jgi:hypothetical protein